MITRILAYIYFEAVLITEVIRLKKSSGKDYSKERRFKQVCNKRLTDQNFIELKSEQDVVAC